MSSCPEQVKRMWRVAGTGAAAVAASVLAVAVVAAPAAKTPDYAGIGRGATPSEVQAWDIDVRPDFKGLPPGSGSVAQGTDLWESKCASCHGSFGEANQTFSPLIGGTTADDVKTGHVARLNDAAYPGRTTLMKVATVSTLWDYIHRAMPWNAPKSLSNDEVYALTAYLLNLASVVPDNYTLSNENIAEVQQKMPNRNGMTTDHALWPGPEFAPKAKPDTHAKACMSGCETERKVASFLPDFARNQHGNLALQTRGFGAERGVDTTKPPAGSLAQSREMAMAAASEKPADAGGGADVQKLLAANSCTACHAPDRKLVGPSFADIHGKYGQRGDAVAYLAGKIKSGGTGLWGAAVMPPQTLTDEQATTIAKWLAEGAKP